MGLVFGVAVRVRVGMGMRMRVGTLAGSVIVLAIQEEVAVNPIPGVSRPQVHVQESGSA